jgi:hypothetical protein
MRSVRPRKSTPKPVSHFIDSELIASVHGLKSDLAAAIERLRTTIEVRETLLVDSLVRPVTVESGE